MFFVVVFMIGLDGYWFDNIVWCEEFLVWGWVVVVVEIFGMVDCLVDSVDFESLDRLWSLLLDWMVKEGRFDMKKVMVWGLSSGGYYVVWVVYMYKERIIGSVV